MTRDLPNMKCAILYPLTGHKDRTPEKYLKEIEKFERKTEKSLIDTFSRVGIKATVKTDPYSLPYKDEVVVTLNGESYVNGPYEFYRVARKIVKEMLEKNAYQVRFYMLINVRTDSKGILGALGQVEYKFRYTLRS